MKKTPDLTHINWAVKTLWYSLIHKGKANDHRDFIDRHLTVIVLEVCAQKALDMYHTHKCHYFSA